MRAISVIAGLLLAAALIPVALLATSSHASTAVPAPAAVAAGAQTAARAQPATQVQSAAKAQPAATDSRGANVVAGIHDTAINDCDGNGRQQTAPTAAQLTAATASLSSRYWPEGVRTVRVTLPWDIADPGAVDWSTGAATHTSDAASDKAALATARQCFDTWLRAVFRHGLQPEIDFRADQDYTLHGTPMMPTLAQYTDAVFLFRNQYTDCASACADGGKVTVIGPWNEPDNYNIVFPDGRTHLAGTACPAHPTTADCGAVMAAQMWAVTHELVVQGGVNGTPCPQCIVVAGDFSGRDGLVAITSKECPQGCDYVDLYNLYLYNATTGQRFHPAKWAVHPYSDIKGYQDGNQGASTQLATFAAHLQVEGYGPRTYIWLNEISTCADRTTKSTCASGTAPKAGWSGQDAAMRYLLNKLPLTVGANGPQVGRIDYYCFGGGESQCSNDWALVTNSTTNPKRTNAGRTFVTWAAER